MSAVVDPILAVTGVSRRDILRRCAERRSGVALIVPALTSTASAPGGMPLLPPQERWRLLDLGEGGDAEFLVAAYAALLGRAPYPAEFDRRLGQLTQGRTRLEIILRLALSQEGRRMGGPKTGGLALPLLVRLARRTGWILELPLLHAILRPGRSRGFIMLRRVYAVLRHIPLLGGFLETLVALTRIAPLRREVMALRLEVERLKGEQRR